MKDTGHGRDIVGSGSGEDGFDYCVQNELEGLQTRGRETAKRQQQLSAWPKEAWTVTELRAGRDGGEIYLRDGMVRTW